MLALRLLFPLLFGWLGYREAAKFARRTGRAPWGCPPWVWALIAGISLLVGGVLLAIARRTTKPGQPGPSGAPGWGAAPLQPAAAAFGWAGPGPERADVWQAPSAPTVPSGPVAATPVASALPPSPGASPTGFTPPSPVTPRASASPTSAASRDILPGR